MDVVDAGDMVDGAVTLVRRIRVIKLDKGDAEV